MSEKLPSQYRETITLDRKVSTIPGIPNRINTSSALPADVSTIGDLLVKRVQLPPEVDRTNEKYDSIGEMLRLEAEPSEIAEPQIQTMEDLKLSLYALITNSLIHTKQGAEKENPQAAFGSEIGAARCNRKLTVLTRSPTFSHSGIVTPQKEAENIAFLETSDNFNAYLITTATVEEILDAPINGLPSDKDHNVVNTRLADRLVSALDLGAPEEMTDYVYTESGSIVRFESKSLDLWAALAPLARISLTDPLEESSIESISILTD